MKIPGMGVSDPDRRIAPIADKQSDRGGRMHTVLTISLGGHQNVRSEVEDLIAALRRSVDSATVEPPADG